MGGNKFTGFLLGILRNVDAVGTHVGNQTDGTFGTEVDTFIELLGHHHGFFGRKPQLARSLLLHRTSGKRGSRVAPFVASFDIGYAPNGVGQVCHNLLGMGLIIDIEFIQLFAGNFNQAGTEGISVGFLL